MALNWKWTDDPGYWYAETAESGTPGRSVWRVIDTQGPDVELWVESGITNEPAHRVGTYDNADTAKGVGSALHAAGKL